MAERFDGKVALVTGAAAGIGRETAAMFAQQGASVVVVDLPGDGGPETVQLIKESGGKAHFVAADVTDDASVAALIAETVKVFGRLDCAFNNAGINSVKDHWEDPTAFDSIVAVNVGGVATCIRHEVKQMRAQGGGVIVNTASINGLVGSPQPGYVGSKHAVIGLTRSAALAFARENIRVNAVCPGVTRTAMVEKYMADETFRTQLESMAPMGRIANPAEIAFAVLWLCSDEASFITGHPLVVDGGFTAQ